MYPEPLVFVDVETTGMSPRSGGRVLELGAIRVENGQVVGMINSIINPESSVPYFITNLTGISDDDTDGAPLFVDMQNEFRSITDGAVFVAHNVGFDYSFLAHEMARLGHSFAPRRLCTVRLSRALYPGVRGHSLGKLIERHGYRVNARHRAYDDAKVLHRFVDDHLKTDTEGVVTTMRRLTT